MEQRATASKAPNAQTATGSEAKTLDRSGSDESGRWQAQRRDWGLSSRWQSQAPPRSDVASVEAWEDYFEEGWRLYEQLFDTLSPGVLAAQPDPLRHPLIFYLGHTAAFYINKLRLAGLLDAGIDEELDDLLAIGVDPARAEELDGAWQWPSAQRLRGYRAQARERLLGWLRGWQVEAPITWQSPGWAFLMGMEHDRIHLETSSVLFRQLPLDQLECPEGWRYAPIDGEPPALRFLEVPGRVVQLGRASEHPPRYGWDNEFGHLEVELERFEASQCLVSNRDFMEFWADGGYGRQEHWSQQGWRWLQQQGVEAPRFWRTQGAEDGQRPRLRVMFDELEMPWSWPVEVNAFEAQAYCRWRGDGSRLLREAEWQALSEDAPRQDDDVLEGCGYNLNLRFGSPTPVDALSGSRSALGFYDVHGNVWQWLSDDFAPLPGFREHPYYAGFSEPFFTRDHASLRGGAWVTTGTGASRHYRLWFRRHFYQHAGFRIARSLG